MRTPYYSVLISALYAKWLSCGRTAKVQGRVAVRDPVAVKHDHLRGDGWRITLLEPESGRRHTLESLIFGQNHANIQVRSARKCLTIRKTTLNPAQ